MNRRHFLTTSLAATLTPPETFLDSHVHVWTRDPAFPFDPAANIPSGDFSAERLLELMAANQVARTVLIQVIHYKWDNRYVLDVLRRFPGKFHAVCRVNPEDPAAPDHLSSLTAQGFHGVRLSPAAGPAGDWIRGPLMPPLWRRCAQLKVPMTLLAPVTRMPDLVPLIESNPTLTVVIDHMADSRLDHPAELEKLLALARYPRVFVKLSHAWSLSSQSRSPQPYPYPDAQLQMKRLRDAFSAARLMAATDWPISLKQLSYAQAVALYRDHLPWLTPTERHQILASTTQRIWPFQI